MTKSKYNNRRIQRYGYNFDSLVEVTRYQELKLLESAGEISELIVHPIYPLQPAFKDNTGKKQRDIIYEADFAYFDNIKKRATVEDVKGFFTALAKLKIKMFLFHYPELHLVIVK